MMFNRVACTVAMILGAVVLSSPPAAHAQGRGTAGDCMAFTDNLAVPVLVQVQSTNGVSPNAAMTGMQTHAAGFQDFPWIIQPGGPQILLTKGYDNSTGYLVSQNGDFNISAIPISPAADSRFAVQVFSWPAPKVSWVFHPEMTENGNCRGAWVGSIGN